MINVSKALLGAICVLGVSSTVRAQATEPDLKAFVSINTGSQGHSRSLSATDAFPLYDETASFSAAQTLFEGGRIFDISGGYRPFRGRAGNLGLAIGFSRFGDSHDATLAGTVPHPLFFNRARNVTANATGLDHSQRSIYFQAVWFQPIYDKLELSVGVGPSFFSVSQDVFAPLSTGFRNLVNANTQEITVGNPASVDGSGTSFMFQVDAMYFVTKNIGGGIFVRRNGATVDLPGIGDVKVGGFQGGFGVRARF